MKIIKQGSVECYLRITCRKCGTIYEIEKKELKSEDPFAQMRDDLLPCYYRCPTCKGYNHVDINDPMVVICQGCDCERIRKT